MAVDLEQRVPAPLTKFMSTLRSLNDFRKEHGKIGYVSGLSPTYGNNAFLVERHWSLGTGGNQADIGDGSEIPKQMYMSFAGVMGISNYGFGGIENFIGNQCTQKNASAGIVALVKVKTLAEIMKDYDLTYTKASRLYQICGMGVNPLTSSSSPRFNWARGTGVNVAFREGAGGWCWNNVENVEKYKDWLVITSVDYYSGATLPRSKIPNAYPFFIASGGSYIGVKTDDLSFYSVTTHNSGAGFLFSQILPSESLLNTAYFNSYNYQNILQYFSDYQCDIITGSMMIKDLESSPSQYTLIDTEIIPSCYRSIGILLHNNTNESQYEWWGGGSVQTSGGYVSTVSTNKVERNQSQLIFPDMQSIIDMFADWGVLVTDDVGIAQTFPTSQIPSGDGQPPAGYDTNDSPTIDNYPDNSTVDFDVQKPLVNYNPAIDTNVMTSQGAGTLLQWLTTSTFLDNSSRLFNEPLSAIIALRYYPFDIAAHDSANVTATTSTTIVNVNCDTVGGYKIGDGYNTRVAGGSMEYTAYYGSYADWTNCRYQLYIPYVGIVDIAPSYVINRRLSLEYIVDFLSGKSTAVVKSYDKDTNKGNIALMRECSMSVDVPIVYSNYNQQQLTRTLSLLSGVQSVTNGAINGAMSGGGAGAAIGAATGLLGSAANVAQTYATTPLEMGAVGTIGSSGGYNMPQTAYLMISRRPLALPNTDYVNIAGKSASVYAEIGAVSGFVKCEQVRLDFAATDREKAEIMSLLSSGVYV